MSRPSSHTTPSTEPLSWVESAFDWAWLVADVIHPLKVMAIEAMLWIGTPLSATDLTKVLDGQVSIGLISYHVNQLAKIGAVQEVRHRKVRGAEEHFYFVVDQAPPVQAPCLEAA